jgi:ADP-heptose:LPS heptosyltransferase
MRAADAAVPRTGEGLPLLVHLAAGVGNLVLATPLLAALDAMGYEVDLLLHADYPQAAELFRGWSAVRGVYAGPVPPGVAYHRLIPAVPPFYWTGLGRLYRGRGAVLPRPADRLFYRDEQAWYLSFAQALGWPAGLRPVYRLPVAPSDAHGITSTTVVLAPGCKTGEMAAKRWPHFAALAERFADVAVVGTAEDMAAADGTPLRFPPHVRSLVGRLTLRETAEALAAAGVVVANDSGLGHVAGAVGAPTVLLFGPTSEHVLGTFPENVRVMRGGLACEPCWTTARLRACGGRVDCLRALTVQRVEAEVRARLCAAGPPPRLETPAAAACAAAEQEEPASLRQRGPDDGRGLHEHEAAKYSEEHEERATHVSVAGAAAVGGTSGDPAASLRAREMEMPLISCVMPTADRETFVPRAIEHFLRQDYPRRELVIVDDGDEPVERLIPEDPRIVYHRAARQRTLGGKRNLACSLARGELVAHWDDDDWVADDRLTRQAAALEASGAEACGLAAVRFFDPVQRRAWEYRWRHGSHAWVAGATLLYRRSLWQAHAFPELREGEDTRWVWSLPSGTIHAMDGNDWFAALVHPRNTSRKHTHGSNWSPLDFSVIQDALGPDWPFYAAMGAKERELVPA